VSDLTTTEALLLDTCERHIGAARGSFIATGEALTTIRDRRLYRADYTTFEAYVVGRFGMSRRHAYRCIDATKVYFELEAVASEIGVDVSNLDTREVPADRPRRAMHVQLSDRSIHTVAVRESVLRPLTSVPEAYRRPVLERLLRSSLRLTASYVAYTIRTTVPGFVGMKGRLRSVDPSRRALPGVEEALARQLAELLANVAPDRQQLIAKRATLLAGRRRTTTTEAA
jgi:hypothetical protein